MGCPLGFREIPAMIGFNRPCTVYCPLFVVIPISTHVSVLREIDPLEFPPVERKGWLLSPRLLGLFIVTHSDFSFGFSAAVSGCAYL